MFAIHDLRIHLLLMVLLAQVAAPSLYGEDKVPWVNDLETARQQALATNRLILVHFTGERCVPCRRLEKNVYGETRFGFTLVQNFCPVKINATASPDIARQFKVTSWPTDIILAPSGHELYRMTSPQDPKQYMTELGQVAWRYRHMQAGVGNMAQFTPNTIQAQSTRNPTVLSPQASPSPNQFGANTANSVAASAAAAAPANSSPYTYQQSSLASGVPRVGQTPVQTNLMAGTVLPPAATNARIPAAPQYNGQPYQLASSTNQKAGATAGDASATVTPFGNPAAVPSRGPLPTIGYTTPGQANPAMSPAPQAIPAQHTFPAAQTPAPQPAAYGRVPDSLTIKNEFYKPKSTPSPSVAVAATTTEVAQPQQAAAPAATARQVAATMMDNASQATTAAANDVVNRAAALISPSNPSATSSSTADENVTPPPTVRSAPSVAEPTPTVDFALDGCCCVTLQEENNWKQGDARWGARHRGRVYLFQSAAAQQRFLSDPDRYSPILAGYDPVVFRDTGELVAGSRSHGVRYHEHMYLFQSEESLQKFWTSPDKYSEIAYQAMINGTQLR